mmetsp:Transcript_30676/g.99197  ORF Transcript_30676/g.99197 Transcript_30676/m.99197 type:complete len:210 (+) Transcript_30676:220-849(+)
MPQRSAGAARRAVSPPARHKTHGIEDGGRTARSEQVQESRLVEALGGLGLGGLGWVKRHRSWHVRAVGTRLGPRGRAGLVCVVHGDKAELLLAMIHALWECRFTHSSQEFSRGVDDRAAHGAPRRGVCVCVKLRSSVVQAVSAALFCDASCVACRVGVCGLEAAVATRTLYAHRQAEARRPRGFCSRLACVRFRYLRSVSHGRRLVQAL